MRVLLAVAVAAATVVVPSVAARAATTAPDPTTRAAMYRSYQDVLKPALAVPIGWTGSTATCTAGAPSAAAQAATLTAVNWYRGVAGLAPVTFGDAYSADAQQAALMMQAQGSLSHSPGASWACYTAQGANGAGSSNLALGTSGPRAIAAYMRDDGSGNTAVGHRRWILDPAQKVMGSGSTATANALYVFGDRSQTTPNPEWVSWPPAGYLPLQAEPGGRWSLSAPGADFSGATVTVTRAGTPLAVTRYAPANGYGSNTLVWQFAHGYATGRADARYDVTVSGIVRNGATVSRSYSVTLFDGEYDADQTISFAPLANRVYDTGMGLSATSSSGLPVTFSSGTPDVCTVSWTTLTMVRPGTCAVHADQSGDATRNPAPRVTRTFEISKRPVTVKADDQSRPGGAANPPLTVSYLNLGYGQTYDTSGIAGSPVCSTTAVVDSAAGSYPITCTAGTLESDRYTFAFEPGELAVGSTYQAVQPARILDTRAGRATVDGAAAGGGALGPGATRELVVTGRGGVPSSGVGAVALSLTVVTPTAGTHVTAWPAGTSRPNASTLNAAAGATTANLTFVRVGTGGRVSLFNASGSSDLIADVVGWYPADSLYRPLVPARVMDTRPGRATVDGLSSGEGPVGHVYVRHLTVTGRGGVPSSGVGAVVLNVTAVAPSYPTFVRVWPAGVEHPQTSSLNVPRGATVANLVVVRVGESPGGEVLFHNGAGLAHLVVDVVGWFPLGADPTVLPARVMDTRAGRSTVDGTALGEGAAGPGGVRTLTVTGRGGVPASGVGAVLLNVVAVTPTSSTYVTAWPAGTDRPNASNINPRAGVTTANLVLVRVGSDGAISLYNAYGSTHFVVDVVGWFPA